MNPERPHDGQNEGEDSRKEAQRLIRQAHGLGRSQSRVPELQDALAGRKRLPQAAVLRNEILANFPIFQKNNKIKDKNKNYFEKL